MKVLALAGLRDQTRYTAAMLSTEKWASGHGEGGGGVGGGEGVCT